MRVVFLRSNPILPDPRVEKEANSLLKSGHEVNVVAWNRDNNNQDENGEIKLSQRSLPITWFNIPAGFGQGMNNLLPLMKFQWKLFSWLIKHRKEYECIHACDFDTAIPAWVCAKVFKKRLVYDIFDYYVDAFRVPRKLKSLIEFIDIKIINSADAVIITNESRKAQIAKSRPRKLEIIHNSPANIHLTEEKVTYDSRDKVKFTYVGILSSGRLLNEILDVFIKNPEWELHIGGFGPLDTKIKEFSAEYDNIHYYGRISYDQVIELEADSDILFAVYDPTVPNHKYASPNKLYEALMLGKPIIVAKGTGIDITVEENVLGKSIEYNGDAFEKAAKELISIRGEFEDIGKRGRALYANQYSWEVMEERLVKLYKGF